MPDGYCVDPDIIEPAEPESPPAPFDGDGYCWLAMVGEELKHLRWALGIAVL